MKDKILLGHGSGGTMSHKLIKDIFVKYFSNPILNQQTDAALLQLSGTNIAFTTDSYVVDPIFFPGGNIGKLAICGTVNDLAVSGADPQYISCGFIIEEGLALSDLELIVKTMAEEADKAGVQIVTGDTKVVNKGQCDKVFINTAGIGTVNDKNKDIASGKNVSSDDVVIINGFIGDHGIAIMAERESLKFSADIKTDSACLNKMIKEITAKHDIHFMRDATRGGVATVLTEIATDNELGIELDESTIPVRDSVRGLCEIFGFDPLYVANEGKLVLIAPGNEAEAILKTMQQFEFGKEACVIGEVTNKYKNKVVMQTGIGGKRIVDMLAGEQLPRIC